MPAVRSVLIVGAGSGGAAAAILLAQRGVAVEVVDVKPDISTVGSGITLQGNALRVLRQLGIYDRLAQIGYPFDVLGLRAPDADGTLLVEMAEHRTGGDDLPATLGVYRPAMAQLLLDRATEVGAKFSFGRSPTELAQDSDGVDVSFSDGGRGRYDLVIGADGVRSWVRRAVGIELEPRPAGMGIWRIFTPRPPAVTRTDLFYGGPSYIAGYCPTGTDSLYAYIVEDAQDRSSLSPTEQLAVMRELAGAYHGPWDAIRASMTDAERVNYTWFESHLLDRPWNRGRVVLIGDAAHCCPPTVAQGAAQALEDAVVLCELLLAADTLDQRLWDAFMDRRFARAKTVVEASVQLVDWLLAHEPHPDVPGLMTRVTQLVREPA